MSGSRERSEPMSHDGLGSPSLDEELRRGRRLLRQGIEHLEQLRREYSRFRSILEELERRIRQREEEGRRLHESLTTLSRALDSHGEVPPPAYDYAGGTVLHVNVLGGFAVRCGDRSISLGSSKKGRAIFRYLVTRPERCAPKDVLLDLFWPGEQPEKAGHKLHIAVSSLRGALNEGLRDLVGEECILFGEGRYCINPTIRLRVDADEFTARCRAGERLLREGRVEEAMGEYEAAMTLYRGDFLPQDIYADWSLAPRARLEEMYLSLLGRLADFYMERGRFLDAIACARQILSRDNFREDAYRLLMRCYSRMGQRNRALREFRACEEVLRRELGVSPMQETRLLYERILREDEV